jgi:hypothetical protein
LFAAARPVILNGIEEVITRPDLADCPILLMLAPIAEFAGRRMHSGASSSSHDRASLAHSSMRPRKDYACCRMFASSGYRAWLTSRSGPQPVKAAFAPRAPLKPRIPTTGAPRSRVSSMLIQWRPLVREIMADRAQWTGSASDLLQVGTNRYGWPKSPRALAGRVRRAQPSSAQPGFDGADANAGFRLIGLMSVRMRMPAALWCFHGCNGALTAMWMCGATKNIAWGDADLAWRSDAPTGAEECWPPCAPAPRRRTIRQRANAECVASALADFRPAIFNSDMTLDKACFLQALAERSHEVRGVGIFWNQVSLASSFTRTCLGGRAGWAGFSKDNRAKGVTCLRARKSCLVRNAI